MDAGCDCYILLSILINRREEFQSLLIRQLVIIVTRTIEPSFGGCPEPSYSIELSPRSLFLVFLQHSLECMTQFNLIRVSSALEQNFIDWITSGRRLWTSTLTWPKSLHPTKYVYNGPCPKIEHQFLSLQWKSQFGILLAKILQHKGR